MNKDKAINIGIAITTVILVALLACEVMWPLSGTTLKHMLLG